jgi:steroid delta-isomerase-like uncharacterized protein
LGIEQNKALVRRYYDELWNNWSFDRIAGILTPDVAFHGSLGMSASGHGGFIEYAETVRAAFPDFHNTVEELIAEEAKVAALLTYRGTHRGPIFGVEPTGKKIEYAGVAILLFRDALISHVWVLGDRLALMQQIGAVDGP